MHRDHTSNPKACGPSPSTDPAQCRSTYDIESLRFLAGKVDSLQFVLDELAARQLPMLERKLDGIHELLARQRKDHYLVEEVAVMVGRSEYTIRRWITEGNLKAIRITEGGPRGRLLIPQAELARLVNEGRGAHIPDAAIPRH